ncbi:hypothetical protein VPH35_050444 [Triticum aestivum]
MGDVRAEAVHPGPYHPRRGAGQQDRLPDPLPRQLLAAGGQDGRLLPGAGHDGGRLQGDELGARHGVHHPEQLRHQRPPGGDAEPDQQPGHLREEQVGLRAVRRGQGGVGEHLPGAPVAERRPDDDPGAARRRGRQCHPRLLHAVPAPQRRALQHPVRGLLVGGRRRGGGGQRGDQRPVRVHGAESEQQPEGGLRQLPRPGHRAERGWRQRRADVREREDLGGEVLHGELPPAGDGEGPGGSRRLLQERAEHPTVPTRLGCNE